MSAFMVSKGHIDRLIALAMFGPSDSGAVRPDNSWSRLSWYSADLVTLNAMRKAEREAIGKAVELLGGDQSQVTEEISKTYMAFWKDNRRSIDHENFDRVGAMLIRENLASIHGRYPDTVDEPENTPGPVDHYWDAGYTFPVTTERVTVAEGLNAINCYEYQSCEHDEWHGSEAKSFCDSLTAALVHKLTRSTERGWDNWDRKSVGVAS